MTTVPIVPEANEGVKIPVNRQQRMLFKVQVTCSGCDGVGELYDYELLGKANGLGWRYCPICHSKGIVEASITIEDMAEIVARVLHSQLAGEGVRDEDAAL